MLFKKKDQNESVKAKTALFAGKAKQAEALEKKEEAREAKVQGAKTGSEANKTLKASVAAGLARKATAEGRVNPKVLRQPRITEKATAISAFNVYTFDVATSANKKLIVSAVKDVYNVTPVKVRIVAIPSKHVMSRRGTHGRTARGKKAYVYLKKGDTIELV
jgi:large subunit ribosomal protein L23